MLLFGELCYFQTEVRGRVGRNDFGRVRAHGEKEFRRGIADPAEAGEELTFGERIKGEAVAVCVDEILDAPTAIGDDDG